jgi:hypothetical protein
VRPRAKPFLLLLILVGTALVAVPARARIVQTDPPAPSPARPGGEQVSRQGRTGAQVCTWPTRFDIAAAFAFDACLGMQAAEFIARMTAPDRIRAEAERAAWRAPRISAREAARRAAAQRRREAARDK